MAGFFSSSQGLSVPPLATRNFQRSSRFGNYSMYKIEIQSDEISSVLQRIVQRAEHMDPLMGELAANLHGQAEQNFADESGPLGAWPALKDPKRQGGEILRKSGRLVKSIAEAHGDDWAQVGTNAVYAAIHQLGGTIEKAAQSRQVRHRTDAKGNLLNSAQLHGKGLIFAKDTHKRALTRRFEQGAHTIGIPARPYLPVYPDGRLQEEAEKSVLDTLNDYLKSSIDQNGL